MIFIKKIFNIVGKIFKNKKLDSLYDLLLYSNYRKKIEAHTNPLNKNKLSGFSQNDEDGITLEIINRLNIYNGSFIEFGVGNGLENNSIILLALGWSGYWFGGEELLFSTKKSKKLIFKKVWITKNNIFKLYKSTNSNPDILSLDLDGNDIYLISELLSKKIRPKLFIVEYNAKFPPPIEFQIDYNEKHIWDNDDYFGASLESFNKLFNKFNYSLICCSLSGANAYFIQDKYIDKFNDVPKDINHIYNEAFYFSRKNKMHSTSKKTLEKLIR